MAPDRQPGALDQFFGIQTPTRADDDAGRRRPRRPTTAPASTTTADHDGAGRRPDGDALLAQAQPTLNDAQTGR